MKKQVINTALYSFLLILALIFFDQITKIWAASDLSSGPVTLIPGAFELRYLENQGAAFGMLQGARTFFLIITPIFSALVVFVLLRMPATRRYLPLRICMVLLIAGAMGNFIDRLLFSYVRDFFYISLIDFPIFNVADIYVTFGVIILIILILFVYKDGEFGFIFGRKKKDSAVDKNENE